jgi:hypothetical protein
MPGRTSLSPDRTPEQIAIVSPDAVIVHLAIAQHESTIRATNNT